MIQRTGKEKHERGMLCTYTLANKNGMRVVINNVGCTIQDIWVPDREGRMADVALGYDSVRTYADNRRFYFGCILGRCAGRTSGGEMVIDGKTYQVTKNAGEDHLHGGAQGFDRVIWTPKVVTKDGAKALLLTYVSPDGEEGYPGTFSAEVTYRLDDDNGLIIDYEGVSDADTIVNLSNHAFFNLKGHGAGPATDHALKINAKYFTPVGRDGISTGEIRPVAETPLDFNEMTLIGARIDSTYEQMILGGAYSHNYVLDDYGRGCAKAAELYEQKSGRVMEVFTTMPGLHLFTANRLDGVGTYKAGATYGYRGAVCLETQYYPDACHHPGFPSPVLRAGERYSHRTIYRFSSR